MTPFVGGGPMGPSPVVEFTVDVDDALVLLLLFVITATVESVVDGVDACCDAAVAAACAWAVAAAALVTVDPKGFDAFMENLSNFAIICLP